MRGLAWGAPVVVALVLAAIVVTGQVAPPWGVTRDEAVSAARAFGTAGGGTARVARAFVAPCDTVSGEGSMPGCPHSRWVWAVDFEGLDIQGSCGVPCVRRPGTHHTERVVVDYTSGDPLFGIVPVPGRD